MKFHEVKILSKDRNRVLLSDVYCDSCWKLPEVEKLVESDDGPKKIVEFESNTYTRCDHHNPISV